MHNKSWLWFAAVLLVIGSLRAAQGPQFGQPLAGLPPDVLALFEAGQEEFEAPEEVSEGLGRCSTTSPAWRATRTPRSAATATSPKHGSGGSPTASSTR
jgi:hypothetical protein